MPMQDGRSKSQNSDYFNECPKNYCWFFRKLLIHIQFRDCGSSLKVLKIKIENAKSHLLTSLNIHGAIALRVALS